MSDVSLSVRVYRVTLQHHHIDDHAAVWANLVDACQRIERRPFDLTQTAAADDSKYLATSGKGQPTHLLSMGIYKIDDRPDELGAVCGRGRPGDPPTIEEQGKFLPIPLEDTQTVTEPSIAVFKKTPGGVVVAVQRRYRAMGRAGIEEYLRRRGNRNLRLRELRDNSAETKYNRAAAIRSITIAGKADELRRLREAIVASEEYRHPVVHLETIFPSDRLGNALKPDLEVRHEVREGSMKREDGHLVGLPSEYRDIVPAALRALESKDIEPRALIARTVPHEDDDPELNLLKSRVATRVLLPSDSDDSILSPKKAFNLIRDAFVELSEEIQSSLRRSTQEYNANTGRQRT